MASVRPLSHRVHPLLPTPAEAKDNPNRIFSDHLPIITEIPLQSEAMPRIKVISWNVYRPGNPYGFDPRPEKEFMDDMFYRPDEDESKFREQNNLQAVMRFIGDHNPDVMTFQEANSPLSFSKETLQILAELGYAVDTGRGGVITVYDTNKFNKIELPEDKWESDARVAVNGHIKTALVSKESKTPDVPDVIINNIWIRHEDFPHETEKYITDTLAHDTQKFKCNSIIVGDFNNRLLSPNAQPGENISTGLVPPPFGVNRSDFTDGALYQQKEEKECHQAEIEILDPETGKIYPRPPVTLEQQKDPNISKPKLIISCAVEHQQTEGLNPNVKSALAQLKIYLNKTSTTAAQTGYALSSLTSSVNFNELIEILKKVSPQVELEKISYCNGQNGINDITYLIKKEDFPQIQTALEIYLELGPAQRTLFAQKHTKAQDLTFLDNLGEGQAKERVLANEFKTAIQKAISEYQETVPNSFIGRLFSSHGNLGQERVRKLEAAIAKAITVKDYLDILSDVLQADKVTLEKDSLGTFLIHNLIGNKKLNEGYLHLNEMEIKQYRRGRYYEQEERIKAKEKIGLKAPIYDMDKKEDRKKVNEHILDKISAARDLEELKLLPEIKNTPT